MILKKLWIISKIKINNKNKYKNIQINIKISKINKKIVLFL